MRQGLLPLRLPLLTPLTTNLFSYFIPFSRWLHIYANFPTMILPFNRFLGSSLAKITAVFPFLHQALPVYWCPG